MNNGTFAAMWTSEGSPDEVRFVALPVFVDPAIASPDSWSRPGLSPYESYFAGLSEYVSPGNGRLGVSQQDLSLPGRGIDLDIGRVYTTPYAFDGSSPFQYDNYTLTNLGYGWSLNFPWLGPRITCTHRRPGRTSIQGERESASRSTARWTSTSSR